MAGNIRWFTFAAPSRFYALAGLLVPWLWGVAVALAMIDIAVESVVNTWDLAALLVIVEEAGGTFTDLRGRRRADGGSALSTNGHLHAAVLARLGLPDE